MASPKRALISLVATSVLVATSLMACSSGATGSGSAASGGSSPSAASKAPITIGGTLGLTGSLNVTAVEYKAVYDYWAQQVNKNGGLLGRRVVMDIKNDNSNAASAQSLYQTLLTTDHVDLLLGPFATFVGVPVVPLALSAHMILFNGGFVGLQYFDEAQGWMVGTYTYQEPDYARGLFQAIATLPAAQRPTKLAVLTNNTPFTVVARDGYKGTGGVLRLAKNAGMQVVFNQSYSSTTTDFTSAINRAKAAGADMLVVLGTPNDSDNIIKTAHVLGFTPKIICACGAQVTTLPNWNQLGSATNYVVGTTVAWPTQNTTGMSALVAFSKSRGETVVPTYDFVAYAILQVLQQAVTGAGTLNQDKLKTYIYSHSFSTVVGTFRYHANGTPDYSQVVTQTVNGKQQPIWPQSLATGHLVVRQ